ncbi:tetratricopeptide repeat protein [Sulfuricaulis sp.]|jgi:tetratricopeptide (TPR) repeat protein|uniref:tetratricopeptide repeat protein n=1 Tax=Sulfuricaulis sp. TaxID=2003553 RepID=UPI00355A355C
MSRNRRHPIRRSIIQGTLVLLFCGAAVLPARAAYVIAPDIVKEYAEHKAKVLKNPDSTEMNFEYAVCLSYMGKIEEGRSTLKKVQALDPRFAEKALFRYTEKYRKNPASLKMKFRLGFLYYFDNKFDQALSILGDIADHQSAGQLSAWALGYMAMIKGEQDKWGEAEGLVRRALRLEPDAYGLHAALAAALKAQGNYLAAVREYFIAIKDRREFEAYEKTLWPPSVPGAAHSD